MSSSSPDAIARHASPKPGHTAADAAPHGLRRMLVAAREELRFRTWSRTSSGRANQKRVEDLRGKHAGRRCFVMGNGPSLLETDIARLRDEVTIVSNAHFLIWDQLPYVPDYLLVEDVLVAEDRAEDLRALRHVTRIFPGDLRSRLGPESDDTLYVRFPRWYRPYPKFSADLSQGAYWGGTVSFMMIQLAAFLGCDPIVLIGFDHNYVVPGESADDGVIVSKTEDVNHIHPDYFGPGYRWHDPNVARMEVSYLTARKALEARGTRVLNATAGGRLEVFDRVDYDSLFSEKT